MRGFAVSLRDAQGVTGYVHTIYLKLTPVFILTLSLLNAQGNPLFLIKSSKASGPSLSVLVPNTFINFDDASTNNCAHAMPPRSGSNENMARKLMIVL
eukprot:12440698-Ditylum_brightwellii.AAC.1